MNTDFLFQLVLNSKAHYVKNHIANWKSDTIDPVIIDAIKHYHIEFGGDCRPVQATKPKQIQFSSREREIINAEVT